MEILSLTNPWWFSDNWERDDPQLREWKGQKYKWIPGWIKEISVTPFSLNFIVGPRQVGKTTGIKLLIRELINSGFEPRNVTYVNCDLLVDPAELRRILLAIKDSEGILILDEVTSVEGWWKVVKGLIDSGILGKFSVIVSGSSTFRLLKYSESFIGRRGKGKDVEVLPLSFPEFHRITGKDFQDYLTLGGFPRSINGDERFSEELILSLDREIARIGRSPKIMRAIIHEILRKAPSALSFSALGKDIGLNHVTAREYAELLEDMFILKIVYHREGSRINFKKEKKFFLRDPAIARAFAMLYGVDVKEEVLYEWVVQEHMYRAFGEIYYYKNSYEVDAIADNLKVEVKSGRAHRRYPRGVIVLEKDEIPEFLIKLEKIREGQGPPLP
ncbi:ATP-binding protein [Pyrococcus kukulkanii]|uniref:ATP-binding protein n=1 Tax=Pyrococcus kukulkanii TaxID=1609559 RepID=UPI0035675355